MLRIALAILAAGVVWACLPFIPGLMGAAVLCVIAAPALALAYCVELYALYEAELLATPDAGGSGSIV